MTPTSFTESNHVLDKPPGWDYDQCEALSVCVTKQPDGMPVVISCWKVTAEELAEINRTGRVWLVVPGRSMPPVSVQGSTPFVKGVESDAN